MPRSASALLPQHSGDAIAGRLHNPSTVLSGQAQGHQAERSKEMAEIQGDFDVVTGQSDKTVQGQEDHRQPGVLYNRPPEDSLAMLHGQPQSRAAGTAARLGTIAAPTPERDIL